MSRFLLAIDNGSQSTKVSIIDTAGRVRTAVRVPLRPYAHPAPGRVVHPGDDVWDSIVRGCREVMAAFDGDPADIAAVGLCTIRFCRAVLDADGMLSEPMMSWMDERVSRAHQVADPRIRYVTTSSGYVTRRLTGQLRDTCANYQGVWPIDHSTWRWSADESVYGATGMTRDMLFELVDPGDLLGYVDESAAAQCALPRGLPVYATANDKAVEALGCGLREPDTVLVSLGTYIAGMTVGHELLADEAGRLWSNFGSVPGLYLYESVGIRRGMWTVSWFRDLTGGGAGAEDALNAGAARIPPGSGGLMTVLDWLAPGDEPFRRGAVLGFDGTQDRFHVYRSILEAIALTLRSTIASMSQALGRRPSQLIVSGGGSKSDVLMQIFADVFDLPATRPSISDAAGLGAAICAAVGAGLHPSWSVAQDRMISPGLTFTPDAGSVHAYRDIARRFDAIRTHTDPLFRMLTGPAG